MKPLSKRDMINLLESLDCSDDTPIFQDADGCTMAVTEANLLSPQDEGNTWIKSEQYIMLGWD